MTDESFREEEAVVQQLSDVSSHVWRDRPI